MHDTWLTRACQGMTMEYHLRGDGGLELGFILLGKHSVFRSGKQKACLRQTS